MQTKKYRKLQEFLDHISKTGQVPVIDRRSLRRELESFGANFDKDEKLIKKLKMYTNLSRAEVMREIWGPKFRVYKLWTYAWIAQYESETGIVLGKLEDSKNKNSALIHLFDELTALAILSPKQYSYATFRKRVQTKLFNGFQWAQGKRKLKNREKLSIKGVDKGKPFAPASMPLAFPSDLGHFVIGGFAFEAVIEDSSTEVGE